MLLLLDPTMKGLDVVTVEHRHSPLGDDRPVINPLIHEMHSNPRQLDSVLQGLLDGVGSGEGGQERWVDIENPIREEGDEIGSEDPHEAGEHQRLHSPRPDHLCQSRAKASPIVE